MPSEAWRLDGARLVSVHVGFYSSTSAIVTYVVETDSGRYELASEFELNGARRDADCRVTP